MAGPTFSNLAAYSASSVPKYAQFEAQFDLSGDPYANPYDPAAIAVDATFTSPTGRTLSRPAFWWQDYTVATSEDGANEDYTTSGSPHWHLRFMPDEVGAWTYTITAVTPGGSTTTAVQTFTATAATGHGPIRVSPASALATIYADGAPFIPIGQNLCYTDRAGAPYGIASYAAFLADEAAGGGNITRLWMYANDRTGLEWSAAASLNRAPNPYDGLGTYSQLAAYRVDRFLAIAEGYGIATMLVLDTFNDFCTWSYPHWSTGTYDGTAQSGGPSPYSDEVGGPIPRATPEAVWTDATARTYFKRRYRYVVARYGAYAGVIWELWNEVGSVGTSSFNSWDVTNGAAARALIGPWFADMVPYIKSIDAAAHLVTSSHEWSPNGGVGVHVAGDGYFDGMWGSCDIVTLHDYYTSDAESLYGWTTPQRIEDAQTRLARPVWVTECGLAWTAAPEVDFDPTTSGLMAAQIGHLREGTHLHNMAWMGAVEGSTGMYYWWGVYLNAEAAKHRGSPDWPMQGAHFPALAAFLAGEDHANIPDRKTLTTSGSIVAYGKGSANDSLLWVRDAANRYDSGAAPGDTANRTITGASVTVSGMRGNAPFRVEVWNTRTGAVASVVSATATSAGSLVIALPDFQRDVALKVKQTTSRYAPSLYAGFGR